jgi:NADH-quinone oxidoreductase subunit N
VTGLQLPELDWLALAPALTLLGAATVALLAAVLVPARVRMGVSALAAAAGFVAAGVFGAILFADSEQPAGVIADALQRDRFGALALLLVCGAGLLAVGVSWSEGTWRRHGSEFYVLLAAAGGGMAVFAMAGDLMVLFLSLEWFSICLYVLCAIATDRERSLEAGLKYLIVGSFGSAVLLFGSALVYGATGELSLTAIGEASGGLTDDPFLLAGLALVLAGLAFKASVAPFHMWTPDVYDGAPTSVTAFMSAATKVVAFAVTARVLVTAFPDLSDLWVPAVAALAVISLAVGNLAALAQRSVKRLLAYSSVSHAGFMLIGLAANSELGLEALVYYLIPYSAMSIGAFAVVAARERELARPVELDDLAGYGWERPLLGVALWVFMLGFAGLPLTGGFVGKFLVFSAAYEADMVWLLLVGVAATAVSLYYYLGVVRALYMRSPLERDVVAVGGAPGRELLLHGSVLACLVVTIGSFVAVQPLLDLARRAVDALPL